MTPGNAVRQAFLTALLALAAGLVVPAAADATFATGGSGRYLSAIDWVDLGPVGTTIAVGGSLTRTTTSTVGGANLAVTCTLSNVTGLPVTTYASGGFSGDALDDLYNVGGTGISNTLVNAVRVLGGVATFGFSCSATLNGSPYALAGLVFADAEASDSAAGEYVEGRIASGATWRVIDRLRDCATSATPATRTDNGTTNTLRLGGTAPQCPTGPAAVAFTEGATSGTISMLGGGASAVALGVVVTFDHGDAPASYGDAAHAVQFPFTGGDPPVGGPTSVFEPFALATTTQPPTRLGASVDPGGGPSAAATADDLAGSGGVFGPDDDEAGGPGSATIAGPTYTQSGIACTGPGTVASWIDFDGSGTFDVGEQSQSAPCIGTSVALTWAVPGNVVAQVQTFQRLRIAAAPADAAAPTGVALSGEAEDYAFSLDVAPPTATVTPPPAPVTVGDTPPANFGCAGAAQPLTCTATLSCPAVAPVPVANGAPLPTGVPGNCTITVTVVDRLGRTFTTTSTYVVLPTPDLRVVKRVDKPVVDAGAPITWTFVVTNPGPGVSKGVTAIDEPSQPVAFSVVRTTAGTCTSSAPVRCDLGTIAPRASVTVTLTGRATIAGTLSNGVTVAAKRPDAQPLVDPAPANNVAAITTTVRGSLRIAKTVDKRTVRAGGRIGYTIRVTNATRVAVQAVRVCDRLPAGLVYVSSSSKATRSNGRFCWDLLTVKAHSSKSIRITTRTLKGTRGKLTNTATVSGRGVSARADAAPVVNVLGAAVRGGGVTG